MHETRAPPSLACRQGRETRARRSRPHGNHGFRLSASYCAERPASIEKPQQSRTSGTPRPGQLARGGWIARRATCPVGLAGREGHRPDGAASARRDLVAPGARNRRGISLAANDHGGNGAQRARRARRDQGARGASPSEPHPASGESPRRRCDGLPPARPAGCRRPITGTTCRWYPGWARPISGTTQP